MKFTVSAAAARGVVALVKDVVPSKAVTQEATGILVEARKDGLVLSAVGSEMFISAACPAEVIEEGVFCANGCTLSDVVSSFSPFDSKKGVGTKDLLFELDVRTRVVLIKSKTYYGARTVNHKRKIPLLDADMFPATPKFNYDKSFEFPAQIFKTGVEATHSAAMSSVLTGAIAGLHLKVVEGAFTAVGTDTLKLSEYTGEVCGIEDFSVVVPPKFAFKASRCITPETAVVRLAVSKNIFWLSTPGVTLGGITIQGAYPDYKALFAVPELKVLVDKKVFLDNINNLDYGDFDDNRVTLKLSPGALVATTSMAANDSIDVQFDGNFEISFDLLHLRSVVRNIQGVDLEIGVLASDRPATFKGRGEESVAGASTILMAMKG